MKRYEVLDLRGKHFALALTIQSELDLEEKYGEDININDILYPKTKNRKEIYQNTIDMLVIMANEGATYAEMFEGKTYDRTSKDELMHFLKLADINEVRNKLTQACILGWERDIELEEGEEKNVDAPGN